MRAQLVENRRIGYMCGSAVIIQTVSKNNIGRFEKCFFPTRVFKIHNTSCK